MLLEAIQAYLISFHLILLHFTDTVFFHKLKVCGNLISSMSTDTILPIALAHFVSLCHIMIISTIFQTFLLLYWLWWSVVSIFDVTIVNVLELQGPRPTKTANLINKCCMCSDHSNWTSARSLMFKTFSPSDINRTILKQAN